MHSLFSLWSMQFPRCPDEQLFESALQNLGASLVAQTVKNLPAIQETGVRALCWDDPLEKGMHAHSSILPWRIPCTEELVSCRPWGRKESDTTEQVTGTRSGPGEGHRG